MLVENRFVVGLTRSTKGTLCPILYIANKRRQHGAETSAAGLGQQPQFHHGKLTDQDRLLPKHQFMSAVSGVRVTNPTTCV